MYKPYIPETLPIKSIDWVSLISKIGEANRAVAEFNGILNAIKNPNLLLSPLVRDEALLSSKIEGTQVDTIDVLKYEAGLKENSEARKGDIVEILNYRKSIQFGAEELERRSVSVNMIKQLHQILLNHARGQDKNPGDFRKVQNYIGSRSGGIENARFVPPDPLIVDGCMDNLINYINSEEKDVLVQAAIFHAQFEIIHPFCDGNGRLGRMLVPLFLYQKKIISKPVLYVSKYMDLNEMRYKDSLREITSNNNWTQWVAFFLDAIIWQSKSNYKTAKAIMEYYDRTKNKILEITSSKHAVPLLDEMFAKVMFMQTSLKLDTHPSRATIYNLLQSLERAQILKRVSNSAGSMGTVYSLYELVDIANGID